jgi:two-component system, OmpR family, response regulator
MPDLTTLGDGRAVSIGVCEDDDVLRDVLRRTLTAEGYRVRATASGAEAIAAFTAEPPHLLVLDIALGDRDGRDVCTALRAAGVKLPVLFLTGRHELEDRLAAFDAGGDDYVTKPFDLPELLVRLRGLLRRSHPAGDPEQLRLDPAAHALVLGEKRVPLTRTEFRLLGALMGASPKVVRRPALIAAGWPDRREPTANTLHSCMARLRGKLRRADAQLTISTVRGVGYALR